MPDHQARRLDGHWFAAAVLLSYAVTALRFALEKVAAPTSWTNAIGVTWLAPDRGRVLPDAPARARAGAWARWPCACSPTRWLVRAAVALLMVVATTLASARTTTSPASRA